MRQSQEFSLHVAANFPFYFELPPWIQGADSQASDGAYTFTVNKLPAVVNTQRDTVTVRAVNPEVTKNIPVPVVQTNNAELNAMTFNIYLERRR
jgi:hypothetical protein